MILPCLVFLHMFSRFGSKGNRQQQRRCAKTNEKLHISSIFPESVRAGKRLPCKRQAAFCQKCSLAQVKYTFLKVPGFGPGKPRTRNQVRGIWLWGREIQEPGSRNPGGKGQDARLKAVVFSFPAASPVSSTRVAD